MQQEFDLHIDKAEQSKLVLNMRINKIPSTVVRTGEALDHLFLNKINELVEAFNNIKPVLLKFDSKLDKELESILVRVQKKEISVDRAKELLEISILKQLKGCKKSEIQTGSDNQKMVFVNDKSIS